MHNVLADVFFDLLQVFNLTSEEGQRTYGLKRFEYNNKDEDNSPNTINDKNYENVGK